MSNKFKAIEKSFEKFMQKIFGLQVISRKKTLSETSTIRHNSHNYRAMNTVRLKQKLLFELEDEKVDWKKEGF